MEQNENQDSIRERIRAYAFDLKLPLVRRDIDLLIQQGLDERWNLWMFTAELLRQEKKTARRTSVGIASKCRVPTVAIPQRNRHGRASARSAEGLAKPLRHLISSRKGATLYYTGIPVPERPIWLQPWGLRPVTRDTPYCSLPCPDCLRR